MVFKAFYLRIGIRIVLLLLVLLLFSYCVMNDLLLRSAYLLVLAIIQTIEMGYYVTRFTKNIQTFLIALRQDDFALHFDETKGSFGGLHRELNSVIDAYKKISAEKETQYKFLNLLVEHITIGIISFDSDGNVYMVNNAFRKLVGKTAFERFTLKSLSDEMVQVFHQIKPGEKKVFKTTMHGRNAFFAIYASTFKLGNLNYKLISLYDITNELNSKEIDAWMKLMKVLTHEIMNSMVPIVSLSDTLQQMVRQAQARSETVMKALDEGLDAIRVRSIGLRDFAESYRKLSKLPTPNIQRVALRKVIDDLIVLLQDEIQLKKVTLVVNVEAIEVRVDEALLSQAILNLLRNALDAVETVNPKVVVAARQGPSSTEISISDNGPGIEESDLEKIFVPFFTTKKNGTGIGLALVRQIVQLHGGEVFVASKRNQETTFTIVLNH